ncbi:hypothetical protein D3C74_305860 [compost metagenome]
MASQRLTNVWFVISSSIGNRNFCVRVNRSYACLETNFKAFNNRAFHPTDEADFICFCRQTGYHADQEGTFIFGKSNGLYVWSVNNVVDDRHLHIRIRVSNLFRCIAQVETDRPSQVVTALHKLSQVRNVVGALGTLQIFVLDPLFLVHGYECFPCGLVEGFVVYAAYVGYETDLKLRCIGCRVSAVTRLRVVGRVAGISGIGVSTVVRCIVVAASRQNESKCEHHE